MFFKCTSCQHIVNTQPPPWIPPSQCPRCSSSMTMIREAPLSAAPDKPPEPTFASTRLAMARGIPAADGTVFVSTMVYALARALGAAAAVDEVRDQLAKAAGGEQDPEHLPVVRAITRLRGLFDVQLHIDAGSTCISKSRSRAFHQAMASGADVWISIDDDVEADSQTLAALVEAVQGSTGICIAPCLLRERDVVNVQLDPSGTPRELASGVNVLPALLGGFGMVAMSRSAMQRFYARYAGALLFKDDDGAQKLGVFHDVIHDGRWYGEDLSFFLRTPPGVRVEALATGHTSHAGRLLNLEELAGRKLLKPFQLELELEPAAELEPARVDGPAVDARGHELSPEYAALLAADAAAAALPTTVEKSESPSAGDDQGDAGQATVTAE